MIAAVHGAFVRLGKDQRFFKALIFVRELPRNTMGKAQKNLLRKEYENYAQ